MRLWTIRREQMEALARASLKPFKAGVSEHLARHFPEACARLGPRLKSVVDETVDEGRGLGIVTERDLAKFLDLTFVFGRGFQRSEAWAARIVASPDAQGPLIERLFEAAMDHLDHARGIES